MLMFTPPAPTTWRLTLPHSAAAVPIARAMVRCAMQDLRATADRTTAQLLTAELVANAVKHTRGTDHPIELVVERGPEGCRVEVHDGDPMPVEGLGAPLPVERPGAPVPAMAVTGPAPAATEGGHLADGRHPAQQAEGAGTADDRTGRGCAYRRGLLLIRALSSASGCRPTPHGKAVWFTLPELRGPRRH
ncbi:ATP-binding protein [Streptomyces inhibens]|uniref:ATP-binding protein n=1 Tax=Streptomyces inhibens TaxID=2293571 RepID=UPI001EE6C116|nr:ATP-binding protein [Streptomyces inhibens]UKY53255.1 ATP-binding protein [Streptomyces inhibens]